MSDLTTYSEVADVLDRLPEDLRTIRRSRGASVRDVQAATGVSNATVSQVENRRHCPGLDTAVALLRWMDAARVAGTTEAGDE